MLIKTGFFIMFLCFFFLFLLFYSSSLSSVVCGAVSDAIDLNGFLVSFPTYFIPLSRIIHSTFSILFSALFHCENCFF